MYKQGLGEALFTLHSAGYEPALRFTTRAGEAIELARLSAGYDLVNRLDSVLEHFDSVLGLKRLRAIHLNDSMTPFASFKDRHETIGKGSLGEQTFINLINHPVLRELPFFLETPRDEAGHGQEIAWLKEHYRA